DDDHAAAIADEHRGRNGVLPRVLEHNRRAAALLDDLPDLGAERARARHPFLLGMPIGPVRRRSPMAELGPVDVAGGADRLAILALLGTRDHGDRMPARLPDELDRLRAEAS